MSWDAIQAQAAISAVGPADDLVSPMDLARPSAPGAGVPDFGRMVSNGIGELNSQLIASQTSLQRLAAGEVQNLHQVMIGLEETKVSFQLFMQVRNRMLEAYQDLMKMQI